MVKEKALVVEEGRPQSSYEHACAQAQGVKAIIDVIGRDSGFSLGPSNTLHYHGRALDGKFGADARLSFEPQPVEEVDRRA